ncbi:MAG TPA: hypothetical protein DEO84_11910, partial [candidate division Zixibacteria bacterium]|nr:hypothetical protein [candidate division Zixibacteria bacterium]
MFAKVALPFPQSEFFTYRVPSELEARISSGMLVVVPFRNSATVGVILELLESPDPIKGNIKDIIGLGDPELAISGEILKLVEFIARQYITTPGMVLKAALPPGTMQRRKLYFYPGVSVCSDKPDLSIDKFLAQVSDNPGRWSYGDLRHFSSIARSQVEELVQIGALTVSPFKGTDTTSLRGKERWIKASENALQAKLKKGSKSETLLKSLLASPNGMASNSLKDL